jgi:chitinase
MCNAMYCGQITPGAPEERKYCYDDSHKKERFSNCHWYSAMENFMTRAPKNWCISGCRTGKIPVSMGHHEKDDCASGSAKAFCCEPNAYTTVKTETPKSTAYRHVMQDYMKNARCIIPVPFDEPTTATKVKRDLEYPLDVTYTLLLALLTAKSRESEMYKAEEKIWNEAMGTQFGNVHFPAAYDYFKGLDSWTTNGPLELAHRVLCNIWSWNARAAKTPNDETLVCYNVCTGETCSDDDDDIPDGDTDFPVARRALDVLPISSHQHHHARRHHTRHAHHEHSNEVGHQLDPSIDEETATLPVYRYRC